MKFVHTLTLITIILSLGAMNRLTAMAQDPMTNDHDKETLIVSIATGNQPLSYADSNGSLQGVDIAYWNELGRRLNKNIAFKVFHIGAGIAQLAAVRDGSTDAVGCSNFGLSGARLESLLGLVIDYKPSFYWSVQFLQPDGKIPDGYADPLTVAKNLLANRKKIGSRPNKTSIARSYLTHIAMSPEPEGLGLSLESANQLLDELIVDISGFSNTELVAGLARGDYFAVWVKDGEPTPGLRSLQAVDSRVSGHNNVPKDRANSQMGTGYLFNKTNYKLVKELDRALSAMILDGTYERLQAQELKKANDFFGYTPDHPNYFSYPYCVAPPANFTLN